MKILFLYPPDRAFPAMPYSSLPTLAGCLRRAGHEVVLRDVNLEVFQQLARPEVLLALHRRRSERLRELESKPALDPEEGDEYRGLFHSLSVPRVFLEKVSEYVGLMRDPERFYQPERFNEAWDALRGVLRFYYGLNPIPSPNYPDLIDRTIRALDRRREDDPIRDIYQGGLIDALLAEEPDLIALSIPFITSYFEAMKLIRHLRARAPHVNIVVGGSLIDTYHDPMIADPRVYEWFDYGMYGECDEAFPKLADTLEAGGDLAAVPNLYFRDAEGRIQSTRKVGVENLNTLPPPDYRGLPMDRYLSPEPVVSFQTSRGCYYGKCTFCSLSFRDNFRLREPARVVEDMQVIHRQTGARMFLLWDSLAPPKTLRAVAREIKSRNLGFYFFGETKFEKTYLNREFVREMGEGGCRFLQFGMESASERILDLIDKGNKTEEIDRMLDHLAEAGIQTSLTWFIGFPTETEEEARRSFDFIEARRHKITLSSYTGIYNLLPDQPLFHTPERYGIRIHRNADGGYYYSYLDGTEPFDPTEMHEAFQVRGDLDLLKHGGYMLYAALHPERLLQLTASHRLGPLAFYVEDWREARVLLAPEAHIRKFGRDPIKDFRKPPEPARLVYHQMSGQVYRLLGGQMKLLEAARRPVAVRDLQKQLGLDWETLRHLLCQLTNRGLLRMESPGALQETETAGTRRLVAALPV